MEYPVSIMTAAKADSSKKGMYAALRVASPKAANTVTVTVQEKTDNRTSSFCCTSRRYIGSGRTTKSQKKAAPPGALIYPPRAAQTSKARQYTTTALTERSRYAAGRLRTAQVKI